jgi:hypothetical protein
MRSGQRQGERTILAVESEDGPARRPDHQDGRPDRREACGVEALRVCEVERDGGPNPGIGPRRRERSRFDRVLAKARRQGEAAVRRVAFSWQ